MTVKGRAGWCLDLRLREPAYGPAAPRLWDDDVPIPLARWRAADVTLTSPCGATLDADDEADLAALFALHLRDCAAGREAAALGYVEAHTEQD